MHQLVTAHEAGHWLNLFSQDTPCPLRGSARLKRRPPGARLPVTTHLWVGTQTHAMIATPGLQGAPNCR